MRVKMGCFGNVLLTKQKVSTHETIQRTLSMPMGHCNNDLVYILIGVKKNQIRMLKPQAVL